MLIITFISSGYINILITYVCEFITIYYEKELNNIKSNILLWCLYFAILIAISTIIGIINSCTFGYISEGLTNRIRKINFKNMINQDVGFYDEEENKKRFIIPKVIKDAKIIYSITEKEISKISIIIILLSAILISFIYNWKLTLILLSLSPIIIFTSIIINAGLKISKRVRISHSYTASLINDILNDIKSVHSFGLEEYYINKYKNYQYREYSSNKRDICKIAFLFLLGAV